MIDQLIMEIIDREGRKDTNNPNDAGGRTKYGISEKWHPEAWKNGPPTLDEAKQIYKDTYFIRTNISKVEPEYLQAQLADFAVLSGPAIAIMALQKIVSAEQDGDLGPITLKALSIYPPESVNTRLVKARVLSMVRIVQKRPSDLIFLFGWLSRALSFLRD